jgi:hypothetical protein
LSKIEFGLKNRILTKNSISGIEQIQEKIGFLKQNGNFFTKLGSRKRFRASRMLAIDSPHKITPRGRSFLEEEKISGLKFM